VRVGRVVGVGGLVAGDGVGVRARVRLRAEGRRAGGLLLVVGARGRQGRRRRRRVWRVGSWIETLMVGLCCGLLGEG